MSTFRISTLSDKKGPLSKKNYATKKYTPRISTLSN